MEETRQLPGKGGSCDEMDTAGSLVWELNHADNFIQLDHFSSQLHWNGSDEVKLLYVQKVASDTQLSNYSKKKWPK